MTRQQRIIVTIIGLVLAAVFISFVHDGTVKKDAARRASPEYKAQRDFAANKKRIEDARDFDCRYKREWHRLAGKPVPECSSAR